MEDQANMVPLPQGVEIDSDMEGAPMVAPVGLGGVESPGRDGKGATAKTPEAPMVCYTARY